MNFEADSAAEDRRPKTYNSRPDPAAGDPAATRPDRTATFRGPQAPNLQGGPSLHPCEKSASRSVECGAHKAISALANMAPIVDLPGADFSGRQAEVGAYHL